MDSQGQTRGIDDKLHHLELQYSEASDRLHQLTHLPLLSAAEHDEALSLAQYLTLLNLQIRRLRLRRSGRVTYVNNQWCVRTSVGIDVGPFRNRASAEAAVNRLAVLLDGVDNSETAAELIRDELKVSRQQ